MKDILKKILPFVFIAPDIFLVPFVFIAALPLKFVRRFGVARFPACRAALLKAGVMPVINHYYEPLFDGKNLRRPLSDERGLPGVDWNIEGQLSLLEKLNYGAELAGVSDKKPADELAFYFDNPSFKAGDCEYWYNIIRHIKPAKIVEI